MNRRSRWIWMETVDLFSFEMDDIYILDFIKICGCGCMVDFITTFNNGICNPIFLILDGKYQYNGGHCIIQGEEMFDL